MTGMSFSAQLELCQIKAVKDLLKAVKDLLVVHGAPSLTSLIYFPDEILRRALLPWRPQPVRWELP